MVVDYGKIWAQGNLSPGIFDPREIWPQETTIILKMSRDENVISQKVLPIKHLLE